MRLCSALASRLMAVSTTCGGVQVLGCVLRMLSTERLAELPLCPLGATPPGRWLALLTMGGDGEPVRGGWPPAEPGWAYGGGASESESDMPGCAYSQALEPEPARRR